MGYNTAISFFLQTPISLIATIDLTLDLLSSLSLNRSSIMPISLLLSISSEPLSISSIAFAFPIIIIESLLSASGLDSIILDTTEFP